MERAPIAYADDGRRHRVSVGDDIDVEIEDFVPRRRGQPETREVSKLTGLLHRVNSTLTIARAQQAPREGVRDGVGQLRQERALGAL